MNIKYNTEELETTLEYFYEATGSAIVLADADSNTIIDIKSPKNPFCELIQTTEEGKRRCQHSDFCLLENCAKSGKFHIHTCHAGLIDTAVPINFNGVIIAYILLGQMRTNANFKDIVDKISDLGLDLVQLERIYNSLTISSEKRIESVSNIAAMLTQYILSKNLITKKQNQLIDNAILYINANLKNDLSIIKICEDLNVSKNALYRAFSKYENCTVGEYINLKRIDYAKDLMINTDKSLQIIADESGFSDYQYFCKTFKKIIGTTPFKYRKSRQTQNVNKGNASI